jgi:hypothetical protein
MPAGSTIVGRAWHPLWAVAAFKTDLNEVPAGFVDPPTHYISIVRWHVRIQCWALPVSLAATKGILVSFFSSA